MKKIWKIIVRSAQSFFIGIIFSVPILAVLHIFVYPLVLLFVSFTFGFGTARLLTAPSHTVVGYYVLLEYSIILPFVMSIVFLHNFKIINVRKIFSNILFKKKPPQLSP